MPGSSEALGSEEDGFCNGTDQPVPPAAVGVASGSSSVAEATVGSMARVAPSIPNGALHLEHCRDSGGLLAWHAGHSTIKSTAYLRLCNIHGNPDEQRRANAWYRQGVRLESAGFRKKAGREEKPSV
jgi:hypothetical protein